MSLCSVDILLPVYNAGNTLAQCLQSISRQSLTDYRCLILDDGSQDDSLAISRQHARKDPRFLLHALAHGGLVATLNHGLQLCESKIVARMDADDIMHRHRLQLQQKALLDDPELMAVGCHVKLFPSQQLGPGMQAYQNWMNGIDDEDAIRREALVECPLAHPSLMARKEIMDYRDQGWPEDYDLILRLLAAGHKIGMVPKRLLLWRHHQDRLSQSHPAYSQEQFTRCKAAHLCNNYLQGHDQYILWGYGNTGRNLRRTLTEQGKDPAFIVELHPGRIGNTIHGAKVVAVDEIDKLPNLPLLVSVAGEGPRNLIRQQLRAIGKKELRDFVCVA